MPVVGAPTFVAAEQDPHPCATALLLQHLAAEYTAALDAQHRAPTADARLDARLRQARLAAEIDAVQGPPRTLLEEPTWR